jgi:hypothetical protein
MSAMHRIERPAKKPNIHEMDSPRLVSRFTPSDASATQVGTSIQTHASVMLSEERHSQSEGRSQSKHPYPRHRPRSSDIACTCKTTSPQPSVLA